jgi:hypothetical protein
MSEGVVEHQTGISAAELTELLDRLAMPSPAVDDVGRIDRIRALETVKGALAAAQARETVAFQTSQLEAQRRTGVPERLLGRGIGEQVALARRESPHRQHRLCGLAKALVHEMPQTMSALTRGEISEWRATLMVQETACLSREHRRVVDAELASRLASMSDHQIRAEAKRAGYRLDPHSVTNRSGRAARDRRVTSKPVPDTMMSITALLPVVEGAAVMAALAKAVTAACAAGDHRSRDQLMADTLVERVTGQASAGDVPIEICLQVTDETLFGGGAEAGWLTGHGPLPAPWCRSLIRQLPDHASVWIRRFFTDRCTGLLSGVDPTRRLFLGITRRAVVYRDRYCRTPYCGAPIRHLDHVISHSNGGPTRESNAQGLCEACNHAKQAPGWGASPGPGGAGRSVQITTPTGHTYTSRPPPLATPEPHQWTPTWPVLWRNWGVLLDRGAA